MNIRKVPETPLTCEVRAALEEYTQRLMNIYPERFIESDPEAWREENRKKQAVGVKFEKLWYDGKWHTGYCDFTGNKEDYREVQEYPVTPKVAAMGIEPIPTIPPYAAERALWKAQREAGTNEVWEEQASDKNGCWWDLEFEPEWIPKHRYRVKPMKLTARICMVGKAYPMSYIGQDWEFTGTREEYRAECEKYGYAILSEIKEVKPKTVKYYFALCVCKSRTFSISGLTAEGIQRRAKNGVFTIIGNIEEREV